LRYNALVLRAFDPDQGQLVPCEVGTRAPWIHARDPSRAELDALAEQFGLPVAVLGHALDVDEIARVRHDESGATLVIVRVPWECPERGKAQPRSTALGIVVGKGRIVTITQDDPDVLEPLLARGRPQLDPPVQFVVTVVHVAAERFFTHLRGIEERIDSLEAKIEDELHNRVILELLAEQKNLVHLASALTANRIMLEQLREHAPKSVHGNIEDALVELNQAIEKTRVERDGLAQTMNAFTSIVSNNLNYVMKFLTALTIVLTLPMVISSAYGMNVALPGERLPGMFWYLNGLTAVITLAVTVWFWLKRWL